MPENNTVSNEQLIFDEEVRVAFRYFASINGVSMVPRFVHEGRHLPNERVFHLDRYHIDPNLIQVDSFQHLQLMSLYIEAKVIHMPDPPLFQDLSHRRARHARHLATNVWVSVITIHHTTLQFLFRIVMKTHNLPILATHAPWHQIACPRRLVFRMMLSIGLDTHTPPT